MNSPIVGAILSVAIPAVLAVVLLWRVWQARRAERRRREAQLDSVYNARMRRERGD